MTRTRTYRTQAVVLRRSDFGEADRIVTLFTAAEGKVRAIAKGVRRTVSRSSGHLELFAHSDLMLARGRDLDVISQAETVRSFRAVREDLLRTSYAYELVEVVDALAEDRQPNEALFAALVQALSALDEGAEPRLLLSQFILVALDVTGFRPQLTECVVCREPLRPEINLFDSALGGAVCPRCAPEVPSGRSVPINVMKVLRLLQRAEAIRPVAVSIPADVTRDVERLLREHVEGVAERQLRAPAFVARVREATGPYQPA